MEEGRGCAPGGSIGGDKVVFSDCTLTDNCDWRGLVEKTPICTTWMTDSADRLVWANTRLADLTDFRCDMDGGSISSGRSPHLNCPGFCTFNDGETAYVQFRHFSGGTIWCVKVMFTQVGDDVYGKAVYAKYMKNCASIDFDFDSGGNSTSIATSRTGTGYGACEITAHCESRNIGLVIQMR